MRLIPILTALVVTAVLYFVVIDRDRLTALTSGDGQDQTAADDSAPGADPQAEGRGAAIRVMAMASQAREVDSAVILRGQTEALRQVEVRAETSGKVISEPLRRGSFVTEGQLLCRIDPGTRGVSLQEMQARLAEAKSRLPEARARLSEAEAQLPAARARILEAEADIPAAQAALSEARAGVPAAQARFLEAQSRVPEAEARLTEAQAMIPAAEAALAEARARVPAAEASLAQAEAGRPEAEARLAEARSRVKEAEINLNAASQLAKDGFAAQTRLAAAEATYEASKAQVQTALSGVIGAEAAVEAAKGQVEGARAAVESAKAQVESARASLRSAESQVQNAKAGIETARSNIQSAEAAVQSALSRVEGASAAVQSAKAALEGASAGIESAKAGEENALSGIQSAEAAMATVEKDIDRLSMHAPFAGLLESDTAELGTLLQPGGSCATVIQLNPIKLTGYVPEIDVARVRLGAPAGARLVDGREVVGAVSFVSRSADPVTRTFRVELMVENEDLTIRDGQTAEIAIEAEGAPAHLVPQSALTLDDEGQLGLRTVDADSLARFLPVTLIRDTRDGVLVAGLPDQVDVITVGQEYVTDGVPVQAVFEEIGQ
ncbi:efflux RND transporter periplasmic adaptor subunit [Tropicibacter oceani]|uniref:Efflux RND transporter periplasmic adaptor subunit n=1 Tax=Tropicibacter oceani TaxID=3058420 RepID=A0ABY8QGX8_9RHOB|nr:efflux RND transporter periplasmic adaptor subunit [Tropicibacter oceani]WGW03271.1 efflux RND transporter periplasmic adaptor subunit [Tropicibacter oceani]